MVTDMPMIAYGSLDKSGDAHAVPSESEDRSLCGGQMFSFAGRPWPMAETLWDSDESPCPECSRAVYALTAFSSRHRLSRRFGPTRCRRQLRRCGPGRASPAVQVAARVRAIP